jgi:hypothetical protein
MVGATGLEPARVSSRGPKPRASAIPPRAQFLAQGLLPLNRAERNQNWLGDRIRIRAHIEVDGIRALLVYRAQHASHRSADAISTYAAASNGGGVCGARGPPASGVVCDVRSAGKASGLGWRDGESSGGSLEGERGRGFVWRMAW